MQRVWLVLALLALAAAAGAGESFYVRSHKTGKVYGPFERADGAKVAIGKIQLAFVPTARGPASFHLRSEKTGKLYGPVPFKHGAPFLVGTGTYTLLLKLPEPQAPPREPQVPPPKPGPQPPKWEERYTKKAAEAALAKGDMAAIMAIGRMAQAQVDTGKNAMATIVAKLGKEETDAYKAAVEKAKLFSKLFPGLCENDPRSIAALRDFARLVERFETTVPLPAPGAPAKTSSVHVGLGIQVIYDKEKDQVADRCILLIQDGKETIKAGLTDSYDKLDWAILAKLTTRLVSAGVEGYIGPSVREILTGAKPAEP